MPLEEVKQSLARFVATQDLWLRVLEGEPAAMAAINRRTRCSACISWVYTPPARRRQGFASAIVARLSQRELDAGVRWCSLFTDLANPTSNHVYAQLGYEPRCDFRHIELLW